MNKYLKYLGYVLRHKWAVFQECRKRGLWYRGLKHDFSKLHPREFFPYVNFFEGGEKTPAIKAAFTRAWMHHFQRNDHHWQNWVRISDDGTVKALEIPDDVRAEMLCDWLGVQKALRQDNLLQWWEKRKDTMILAPKTKRWLDQQIRSL